MFVPLVVAGIIVIAVVMMRSRWFTSRAGSDGALGGGSDADCPEVATAAATERRQVRLISSP